MRVSFLLTFDMAHVDARSDRVAGAVAPRLERAVAKGPAPALDGGAPLGRGALDAALQTRYAAARRSEDADVTIGLTATGAWGGDLALRDPCAVCIATRHGELSSRRGFALTRPPPPPSPSSATEPVARGRGAPRNRAGARAHCIAFLARVPPRVRAACATLRLKLRLGPPVVPTRVSRGSPRGYPAVPAPKRPLCQRPVDSTTGLARAAEIRHGCSVCAAAVPSGDWYCNGCCLHPRGLAFQHVPVMVCSQTQTHP